MPVWGFADVSASRVRRPADAARACTATCRPRPSCSSVPSRVHEHGFIDASPHRAALPAAYNGLRARGRRPDLRRRARGPADAAAPAVLHLLSDRRLPARTATSSAPSTVVLSSASSKTASALAFLLARREGIDVVGLTSARSGEFARRLGVYDHVFAYDELDSLPRERAVYVDMAGDAELRDAVHGHYREELAHSAVVGATHHDSMGAVPDSLPGPATEVLLRARPGRQAHRRLGPRRPRSPAGRGLGSLPRVDRRLAGGDPRARPGRRSSAPTSTCSTGASTRDSAHVLSLRGCAAQPPCSTSLPVFSPLNRRSSVSGKLSKPSAMSSRETSLPAASQPAISRAPSA